MPKNKPHDVFACFDTHGGDYSVCWEWTRSVTGRKNQERPYFTVDGTRYLAYRLVYILVHGPESLGEKDVVRHTCDNRLCGNPTHLEKGSHDDNMKDMRDRERHGMPHHAVRAIRRLAEEGKTHREIAELYGISRRNVTDIVNQKTYREVE